MFNLAPKHKVPKFGRSGQSIGDGEEAGACYIATCKGKEKLRAQAISLDSLEPLVMEKKLETKDGTEEFSLNENRD